MKEFTVEGHEPSYLPDGEWDLVWADEFDGTELDLNKWDYRLSMMGQRWMSWTDRGVHLDGKSHAVFTLMQNEDGNPVCSQLQTGYNYMDEPVAKTNFWDDDIQWNIGKLKESKFTHSYGYYECRCRLQQKPGWWSAFWIQSPIIGASLDSRYTGTELDIMESFEPGTVAKHNAITGGYGLDCKVLQTEKQQHLDEKEFHRFGLLWDVTGYTFYVDGKEDGKITGYLSSCPEFILISTEVRGYRQKGHQACKEAFESIGDTFLVDHVRVFEKRA